MHPVPNPAHGASGTLRALLLAAFCALVGGCASFTPEGFNAEGKASYYGAQHHGQRTASGERFDRNALTAAHRSLPFGTRVLVTNLRNDKQVVVRINDRGPFSRGRIIDLSQRAAERIGMTRDGIVPVRIQRLAD